MPTYRVVWEIDIDADSPREAAQRALEMQRDPESTALVFDTFVEGGAKRTVDLLLSEAEDEDLNGEGEGS